MFKKFSSEEVSAQNQVKASVQQRIRQSIAEEYPGLEPVLDDFLPKKSPLIVVKWGAIRFVSSGVNIMCPGLTSPGGALDDEAGAETPVGNYGRGKAACTCYWLHKNVGEGYYLATAEELSTKELVSKHCII